MRGSSVAFWVSVAAILIGLLIDLVATRRWSRWYYKHGVLVFKAKLRTTDRIESEELTERLNKRYEKKGSSLRGYWTFKVVDQNKIGVRFEIFQLQAWKRASMPQLIRGLISINQARDRVELRGFLMYSYALFGALWIAFYWTGERLARMSLSSNLLLFLVLCCILAVPMLSYYWFYWKLKRAFLEESVIHPPR